MNVFTTDHALVAQPSGFDAADHRLLAWLSRVFLVALILCPILLGVAWLALALVTGDSPEVPEPAWTDVFVVAAAFVTCFPVFAIVHLADPLPLADQIYVYGGVVLNGIFWAILTVSLWQILASRLRRKRSPRDFPFAPATPELKVEPKPDLDL